MKKLLLTALIPFLISCASTHMVTSPAGSVYKVKSHYSESSYNKNFDKCYENYKKVNHPLYKRECRDYLASKYSWPLKVRNAVDKSNVFIGMTRLQVFASLGPPSRINKSQGSWGTHEQLVYYPSYLYIKDGKLSSIQTSQK